MSGTGAPDTRLADQAGEGLRVVLLAATWHTEVMTGLRGGATRALTRLGVDLVAEIEVPGCFELPVAAARVLQTDPGLDAVVAVGVVLRGQTPHFDYVCTAATIGLTEVTVRTGVPIGYGVLTCDTLGQALERAGLPHSREDKGAEAAEAAVSTALSLRGFGPPTAVSGRAPSLAR